MFDIHCHLLPAVDDGAKNIGEAVAIVRASQRQGVRGIVATPHYLGGGHSASVEDILAAVDRLKETLTQSGLTVDVYPGMEAYLSPNLCKLLKKGDVITLNNNGRYILIELPFNEIPLYCEETLFLLAVEGIIPVIAHPERNQLICSDPDILAQWVERGILVQINAGSLLGLFGGKAQRTAQLLLLRNLVHCVASDAHSACYRLPLLATARERVLSLCGAEQAYLLFHRNPEKIINGQAVEAGQPRQVSRWALLSSRLQKFHPSFGKIKKDR